MSTVMNSNSPWWKEPMVWLIIALPLAAVVAGVSTVIIASRNADTLVRGDYRKEGLALSQSTERDRRAAELGLSARFELDSDRLRVSLLGRLEPLPGQLVLRLVHPTLADKDLDLELAHQGDGVYASNLPDPRGVAWQVLLEPADQSWRLAGHWNPGKKDSLRLEAINPSSSTRP